ncbi:hypothetical protein [Cupriavidus sp. SK-3]|uniref:hypothetical protein n=1 Tax=Cupriavidus sp. SK-3 TaxID=1470558 RepID=UPI001F323F66|nr:hypothetical protein [Cupriavidus sp. SK-3]
MSVLTLEQLNTLAVLLDSREERIRGQMDAANVARAVSTRPEAGDMADLAEQAPKSAWTTRWWTTTAWNWPISRPRVHG